MAAYLIVVFSLFLLCAVWPVGKIKILRGFFKDNWCNRLSRGLKHLGLVYCVVLSMTQAELKRLYTQLQVYKTKTMRRDNPHISKRRGGRKSGHRRFSLQAFHHKNRLQQQSAEHSISDVHELEPASRTPEESTNSAEVPPLPPPPATLLEEQTSTDAARSRKQ